MRSSSVDIIILETLNIENAHLTTQEIYEMVRSKLPAVNTSTVYRALERLAKSEKISVSDIGTGSMVYESLFNGMHHHLVCQKCGRTTTLNHAEVMDFFQQISAKYNFRVITSHLVLFGICDTCSELDSH
jgi:Fur family ferric uptake transcriptional regulator